MHGQIATLLLLLPLASLADGVSRFATLDGSKVHYVSYGSGDRAVVFIHGWTCDASFWQAQAPVYETTRSLLIDLPGHGQSDKPEIPYTMDLFARAVDAVMTDAGVTKATLAGHSMGTPVIVRFLQMHPDKVAGLVFVDGFVPQPPKDDAARERVKAQMDAMVKAARAPDYKAGLPAMLAGMFTPRTDPLLRERIELTMLAAPQYVSASAREGMTAMSLTGLTERYPAMPAIAVMVKRGTSDPYRDFLKQHFQLVDFVEFDNSGHFVMMEQPAKFNAVLRQFLERKTQ